MSEWSCFCTREGILFASLISEMATFSRALWFYIGGYDVVVVESMNFGAIVAGWLLSFLVVCLAQVNFLASVF